MPLTQGASLSPGQPIPPFGHQIACCISPVLPTEAGWAPTISHLDQSSPTSFFPSRLAIFKTPSKMQPEGLCSHSQLIFVPLQLFSSPITLHFLLAMVKFMSTHAHTPQSKNTECARLALTPANQHPGQISKVHFALQVDAPVPGSKAQAGF